MAGEGIPLFKPDRYFHIMNEGWYIQMKGGNHAGPFLTKTCAKFWLGMFILFKSGETT